MIDRMTLNGWISRIRRDADPVALLDAAFAVLARLPEPGIRVDRRTLVAGRPHALDGGVLPSLILAMAGANKDRPRQGWGSLGVELDDLLGGLIATGIAPEGWTIPSGVAVTYPPRALAAVRWQPAPAADTWVFVTENPSVLGAAIDLSVIPPDKRGVVGDLRSEIGREASALVSRVPARVLCTAGTPSGIEAAAVAALSSAGWNIAVRADFDPAGLAHMRALLRAAPDAVPWRMRSSDYLALAEQRGLDLALSSDDTPWDTTLAAAMVKRGAHVYEEDLLPLLIGDIRRGHPPKDADRPG
jgi:uncharacterized protein (TIGR02679 family)